MGPDPIHVVPEAVRVLVVGIKIADHVNTVACINPFEAFVTTDWSQKSSRTPRVSVPIMPRLSLQQVRMLRKLTVGSEPADFRD